MGLDVYVYQYMCMVPSVEYLVKLSNSKSVFMGFGYPSIPLSEWMNMFKERSILYKYKQYEDSAGTWVDLSRLSDYECYDNTYEIFENLNPDKIKLNVHEFREKCRVVIHECSGNGYRGDGSWESSISLSDVMKIRDELMGVDHRDLHLISISLSS